MSSVQDHHSLKHAQRLIDYDSAKLWQTLCLKWITDISSLLVYEFRDTLRQITVNSGL